MFLRLPAQVPDVLDDQKQRDEKLLSDDVESRRFAELQSVKWLS